MDKEKQGKIINGITCCGNRTLLANCSNCPYLKLSNCTAELLADCGELVAELLGVNV